jgi:hypothetical protein
MRYHALLDAYPILNLYKSRLSRITRSNNLLVFLLIRQINKNSTVLYVDLFSVYNFSTGICKYICALELALLLSKPKNQINEDYNWVLRLQNIMKVAKIIKKLDLFEYCRHSIGLRFECNVIRALISYPRERKTELVHSVWYTRNSVWFIIENIAHNMW